MDPKKLKEQEDAKKKKQQRPSSPPVKKRILTSVPAAIGAAFEKASMPEKKETPDKSPTPPKYRLHNDSQPSKSKALWDTITEKRKK